MKLTPKQRQSIPLIVFVLLLLTIFIFVAVRSGPLAPISVTLSTVESRTISPDLSGVGTVQARYTYKIGPVITGKIVSLNVNVGERVKAGQLLGEMDAVDIAQRLQAQEAAIRSSEAIVLQATAKEDYAKSQARRYEQLILTRGTSEETLLSKRQELAIASATLSASISEIARLRAEREALLSQLKNLNLLAFADGLVTARNAEPGSTVTAGQTVIEIIDPDSLWINARFDQHSAEGLSAGLPAEITLRSRQSQTLAGSVLWVEPKADAVTEEMLAKIVFATTPTPLPSIGELAQIRLRLPALAETPTVLNAAIRTLNGQRGVWKLTQDGILFVPVVLGRTDLDGHVQVLEGLQVGDQVVLYSDKTLKADSRVQITESLTGTSR